VRIWIAIISFFIALMTTALVPAAYFGDKNETWTKRLIVTAFVACVIFLIALLR
jgi:hypothetical protein